MASGQNNYFRHSFFASEDPKIQTIVETMGFEGYGYYFSLLEICGRMCADEIKNPIDIHINTVRKVWRKNTESTKKVLRKLEESGLFLVTFSEHSVSLDIPNFGKYIGKYDYKSTKEKKEKEKKRKESKADFIGSNFFSSKDECEIGDGEKNLPEIKPLNFRNPEDSVLSGLIAGHPAEKEISSWLKLGEKSVQRLLLETYEGSYLASVIPEAFFWQKENKKRKAGRFIKEWIGRDSKRVYIGGLSAGDKLMMDFVKENGIQVIEKGA